jgi:hypothetical protein
MWLAGDLTVTRDVGPPEVRTMLAPSLLPLLLAAATGIPAAAARVPYVTTEVTDLAPRGLQHDEVLRIRRDFGKPSFEIVVDSWLPAQRPERIADVRLWWVQNDADDRRSPFGKKVHKYVELEYVPHNDDSWSVTLRADRKEFRFDVELTAEGDVQAYADIVVDGGITVQHCRATEGRLVARRLLGLPIGIKQLELTCVDAQGERHQGAVSYRKLKRGPVYAK